MHELKITLLNGGNIHDSEKILKHADWADEFMTRRTDFNAENADAIIQEEIGHAFEKVLECAGVFKYTPKGREYLKRFISQL